ncbi:MAG: hypothetical protein ACC657_05555 [Thiohalomonadales bacterium]
MLEVKLEKYDIKSVTEFLKKIQCNISEKIDHELISIIVKKVKPLNFVMVSNVPKSTTIDLLIVALLQESKNNNSKTINEMIYLLDEVKKLIKF